MSSNAGQFRAFTLVVRRRMFKIPVGVSFWARGLIQTISRSSRRLTAILVVPWWRTRGRGWWSYRSGDQAFGVSSTGRPGPRKGPSVGEHQLARCCRLGVGGIQVLKGPMDAGVIEAEGVKVPVPSGPSGVASPPMNGVSRL